jgi:hypothetical protein
MLYFVNHKDGGLEQSQSLLSLQVRIFLPATFASIASITVHRTLCSAIVSSVLPAKNHEKGCQIFLGTIYQNGEKYQIITTLPKWP